MKRVEEQFHGKNIEFVGISVDTKRDYEKWKKFVTTKDLKGIQLFADNDWNSDFVKAYGITGIPRFILIDPKGNIVNANADRPSSPALTALLSELLK
jgi:alkyl hydroperoxide reductase subunit AhpC